ncbi:hypothetical protein [Asticcacaulis solisilvae]|uniref:hypothetical protein n=1 Tax=Asticcacaulis solisilvae TaxID=1217274 RepID=UPI003FD81502
MPAPFITTVLDLLPAGHIDPETGCQILSDAIAPEVGVGTPSGLLRRLKRYFAGQLQALLSQTADRATVESALSRAFDLAAAHDYQALSELK